MGRRKPWAGAKEQIIADNDFAEKRQEKKLRAMRKVEQVQKDR